MTTTIDPVKLEAAVNEQGYKLYPKEEWDKQNAIYEERGINFELNCMLEEALDKTFEVSPELFEGANWFNDDNGLPLWIRPGVEWVPDNELEDD